MDDATLLIRLIERHYHAAVRALQPLDSSTGKRIYRVDLAGGQYWTLRAYAAKDDDESSQALASLLLFLEQQGYPAERIIRSAANHGRAITDDGWHLLITTFIEGTPTDYSPATLRLLGMALGRLHTLPLQSNALFPPAEMRPATEVPWALGQLANVTAQVPKALQEPYQKLGGALRNLDVSEDGPGVLLHNDCHPDNTIHTPAGQVVLLDWEGAGLGPAGIDVGFLLASCDTESPWTPPLPPDPARVRAIVDGYCQYHHLTAAELERLPDAIRFRALVYGAASLADKITRAGNSDDANWFESQWWWKRALAADDIAARARKHFERYL